MGYIGKEATVSMKARVTALGSKFLLTDPGRFNISQFALYDDEVDYTLWNEAHDNGSDYHGARIEGIPVFEPTTNDYLQCQYPLLTGVDPGTISRPVILFDPEGVVDLDYSDRRRKVRIEMLNADPGPIEAVLYDTQYFDIAVPGSSEDDILGTVHRGFSKDSKHIQPKRVKFNSDATITFMAKRQPLNQVVSTKVSFKHRPSGAEATLIVQIKNNKDYESK